MNLNQKELRPYYGVTKLSEGFYESENYDPQFLIDSKYSRGWIQIEWQGYCDEVRNLKLYVDSGNDFNEEESYIIGSINSEKNKKKSILFFAKSIKKIRVDPGDSPGKFELSFLKIAKISSFSQLVYKFNQFRLRRSNLTFLQTLNIIQKKIKTNGLSWFLNKVKEAAYNKEVFINNQQTYIPYTFIKENKIIDNKFNNCNINYSVIIPINSNVKKDWLKNAIDSIINQSYENWRIILGCSDSVSEENEEFRNLISNYESERKLSIINTGEFEYNQTIRESLNSIKNEEFTLVMDQEDYLAVNSLYYLTEILNDNKSDIVFFDEDRFKDIDEHFAELKKHGVSHIKSKIKNNRSFLVNFNLIKEARNAVDFNYYEFINNKINKDTSLKLEYIPKVLYHRRNSENTWGNKNKPKIIAFYLPQFHEIPENNEWWGEGFTEWTNVRKANPLFEGHNQPHIPTDLGYYDLILNPEMKKQQGELAKEYNIFGFCYYYYWFNGRRLLEKPLNDILANKEYDFPFCICWANESWSRRWDGQEKEVLMKQEHNHETDIGFIEEVLPILKDERYININGAPLLLIYRADLFPDLKQTVGVWREIAKNNGLEQIHVCMVQSFGLINPNDYGCDSAVEFPPHGVVASEISKEISTLDAEFSGNIYNYNEVIERALQKENNKDFTLFRGAMLGWDNTARRSKASNIFHNASPEKYEVWLTGLVNYTKNYNDKNNQFIFVNAWNEWAEGTHLEPDEKYGREYLEATKRAINSK